MANRIKLLLVSIALCFSISAINAQADADVLTKVKTSAGYTNYTLGNIKTYINASVGSGSVTGVTGTANRITATVSTTNPTIDIASTYVGQASITTLGTITSGTWNGTTVGVANGGTGATTFTSGALLKGAGTSALTTATAGTDYLAPFASQTANSIFAAPSGSAGVPSFRAIVASDIPTLNQSTTGNAYTATTATNVTNNANLTGSVVTSVGNATSITAASIANSMLTNPTTSVNGVTLTLGGTQAAAFTLLNVTTAGSTTNVATTFSGGLTASGANLLSGATTASGGLTSSGTSTLSLTGFVDTLIVTNSNLSLTKSNATINNGATAITLTIPAGLATGTIYFVKVADGSTGTITVSSSENVYKATTTTATIIGGSGQTYQFNKNIMGYWSMN